MKKNVLLFFCFYVQSIANPIQHKLLLSDEGLGKLVYIDEKNEANNWNLPLPGGTRDLQLIGNNRVLTARDFGAQGGYTEIDLVEKKIVKEYKHNTKTYLVYRRPNGETIVGGENIDGNVGMTLTVLDTNDHILLIKNFRKITAVRTIRENLKGNLIVGSNNKFYELDWSGNILMEKALPQTGYGAYKVLELQGGSYLVTGGYNPVYYVYENLDNVQKVEITDPSMKSKVKPHLFSDIQLLPNGHKVICNWQGHGAGHGFSGHQILEFDEKDSLVWSYQQKGSVEVYSSIHHALVLDDIDIRVPYSEKKGVFAPTHGCTDPQADNYNEHALYNDGSCITKSAYLYQGAENKNIQKNNLSYDLLGRISSIAKRWWSIPVP